jgi:hypothetical protein
MNAPTCARPLRLSRPWPWRAADELGARLAAGLRRARSGWARLQCRWREARELETASELSEATLRDMGAPDWLQAQANARREVHRLERDLLGIARGSSDGRYY